MPASPRYRNHRRLDDVQVEVDARSATILVLERYLERARNGDVAGVLLLAEHPRGGYEAAMTGTRNAAERLGRLRLLEEEVLARAEDDGELD